MSVVGRRIVAVREMSDTEMAKEGWTVGNLSGRAVALVLDDGSLIYAGSDYMGNDKGALFHCALDHAGRPPTRSTVIFPE